MLLNFAPFCHAELDSRSRHSFAVHASKNARLYCPCGQNHPQILLTRRKLHGGMTGASATSTPASGKSFFILSTVVALYDSGSITMERTPASEWPTSRTKQGALVRNGGPGRSFTRTDLIIPCRSRGAIHCPVMPEKTHGCAPQRPKPAHEFRRRPRIRTTNARFLSGPRRFRPAD